MGKQCFPDTYSVPVRIVAQRPTTNPRYRHFTQTHFTAGDEEQFDQHYRRVDLRPVRSIPGTERTLWSQYCLDPEAVRNTFEYIFFKFKKGMLIQIRDGQLINFLPFSNAFFVNEWSHRLRVPVELLPSKTVLPTHAWYANNGLFRYESPCNETDTGTCQMKNMFEALCQKYGSALPDLDLFVNRRDFPLLKTDGTEPYHHLYDSESHPLVSKAFATYAPILSSCTADGFADLPIPTMDDWTRVQYKNGLHFASSKRTMATVSDDFLTPWSKKRELAVFRGSNTGMGLDPDTNPRLKLVVQFQAHPRCNVGLTSWNTRPRKIMGNPAVQVPQTHWVKLSNSLSLEEQSMYKYIIHVEGHVQAYRLSVELAMRSVILLVQSRYRLWYESALVPWVHYVPVAADLSDLDERIQWCLDHDAECQQIATQARAFYDQYLSYDGCLNYLKGVVDQIAEQCGYATTLRARLPLSKLEHTYVQYLDTKPVLFPRQMLFKNVNTTVQLVVDQLGQPYVYKQSTRRTARYDHEFFVGRCALNPLTQRIPNFVYTYALTSSKGLYLEYAPGMTLFEYIRDPTFRLNDWYFSMLQTVLAIGVAQRACFFTHHDLCPWNIVMSTSPREQIFDYLLAPDKVIRVYTNWFPVILDYDKSHVVVELQSFSHFFGYHSYQDILCLLVSCLYNITKYQKLRPEEEHQLLVLFTESLCDPVYCPREQIQSYADMVQFLREAHRYAHISFAPKGALSERSVVDVTHLLMGLHRPTFTQRCEVVEGVQYRFLRGVRPDRIQETFAGIERELHPLLALAWKQTFWPFIPDAEDDGEDRPTLDIPRVYFPQLGEWNADSILALSPRYLDHLNLLVDLLCDNGPYRLRAEERLALYPYVQNESIIRTNILAYSKHLTKIKLTRNIL